MSVTTRRMGAAVAVTALLSVVLVFSAGAADETVSSVDFGYHCDSAAGHSETDYTMTATAPDQVVQGTTFQVSDFVVTGIPPEDLLISHISFAIDPPANATSESPLFYQFDGPGSTVPPGPIAKKGIPNSSPAMSFTLQATGPVGSTIDIYPGNVSSTVVNPDDLSQTLDVTCARDLPVLLARITIVAPPDSTTSTTSTTTSTTTSSTTSSSTTSSSTTSTTGPATTSTTGSTTSTSTAVLGESTTPPTASVLGESTTAATAVSASPALTG